MRSIEKHRESLVGSGTFYPPKSPFSRGTYAAIAPVSPPAPLPRSDSDSGSPLEKGG
ncbi:unknown protein [Microcystis aeruginosa NIES-843]|uniref:Uncharacterized protein n=1 Tax=Microcystis aeruginosa (strain NIES-843 / IAM M-2473) TaxID=449447 RepID=B0JP14_MICAN|nr:unknown protein [Microcystis aeruginosa NIES-843]